jgi:hypothetical protein
MAHEIRTRFMVILHDRSRSLFQSTSGAARRMRAAGTEIAG